MKIKDMEISVDKPLHGRTQTMDSCATISLRSGFTSSALPKDHDPTAEDDICPGTINDADSDTGVSTSFVPDTSSLDCHWFSLRCTYGREKKAADYLMSEGIKVFHPTITRIKCVNGKKVKVQESRLPNIFFAYGTMDTLKKYVYDNVHDETKYIRFYYNQHHDGTKEPMIIPDRQINSLMLICGADVDDILIEPFAVEKFIKGQHVLVKEGPFAGVEGIVARFRGQQRVGISINGLFTMVTAYIPTAFLKHIHTTEM